ncbi:hypothetical protein [Bacillus mycoides]|uniref:hypothetical protein n=1 Tax=Bacillus mycoides TaxID=1405 RepID=UPI0007ABBCD7|nr:hypothetical protein [Bacillus mycoides]KZE01259.1 hypothetical protein B4117_5865 [Bacillus mycoides]
MGKLAVVSEELQTKVFVFENNGEGVKGSLTVTKCWSIKYRRKKFYQICTEYGACEGKVKGCNKRFEHMRGR